MGGIVTSKKASNKSEEKDDFWEKTSQEKVKALHSAIRWEKKDWDAAITCVQLLDTPDEKNGNTAIHLAAQNGHLEILNDLIKKGANVNAKNKKGTTALHMAVEYDYFWTAQALKKAGADEASKNNNGFAATSGIDGNKDSDVVTALSDARTKEHVVAALDLVEKHKDEVDKARFVQAFMAKKKENKDLWPEDVTSRTKAIIKKLS
eukprot:g958.t1